MHTRVPVWHSSLQSVHTTVTPSTQNMRHVGLHLTPCENTVLVYERENIQKAFFSQRQQRFVRMPVACR